MNAEIVTTKHLTDLKNDLLNKLNEIELNQKNAIKKRWLRTDEAAEYLNISKPTLLNYRVNNVIPCSKIGGSYYYDVEQIDKLLMDNKI
ncbi:helix-turn-helix domain-containing protein [Haloflavibacter putidus]|uniref:Helix-turn-helix domain-containing protein n=1 Tax=Haloflavibacter putidus TaxID=2576776 RepID=A0A507ZPS0_9FLAO|nr:helix-turn-helix domain-containing protein [Haloflavibacter putidus]TQD39007.1 helix-turn-helix domain-containing protein [Haloflavibacter putidus]